MIVPRPPRLLIAASVPETLRAFLMPYAERYRARGWRVDAAAHGVHDAPELAGVFDALHELPWTRDPTDAVNLRAAPRALRSLVTRERYDVVHVHDPIAGFVSRLALRGLRRRGDVRLVYTAHGFHFRPGGPPASNLLFWSLERLAAPWTDRLVVINRDDEQAARRWPVPVVRMPGIGVDLRRYDPVQVKAEAVTAVRAELRLAPAQPLLVMVAELNPGKRHADALASMASCGRPDVVLACAGVGPEEESLRARASALGIAHRVRWLGWRRDVPVLIRAAAALLLPSEREGLPRCVMEACCLERPVIGTRIRGTEELVSDANGVLVEVGDIEAIAAAIRRIVDDPADAADMGRAGRRAMEPFDIGRVLAAHDRLYAELLDDRADLGLGPAGPTAAASAIESDTMP